MVLNANPTASTNEQQMRNRRCMQARAVYDLFACIKQHWNYVLMNPTIRAAACSKAIEFMNDVGSLYDSPCEATFEALAIKPTRRQVEQLLRFVINIGPTLRRSVRISEHFSEFEEQL